MRCLLLLFLLCSFAIAQQPQPPDAELAAARALMNQGRLDDAIAKLTAMQQQVPSRPEIGRELGIAYYRKGDFLHATTLLQEAFTRRPEDNDAAQLLGLAYYLSGRPAAAIAPLEKLR